MLKHSRVVLNSLFWSFFGAFSAQRGLWVLVTSWKYPRFAPPSCSAVLAQIFGSFFGFLRRCRLHIRNQYVPPIQNSGAPPKIFCFDTRVNNISRPWPTTTSLPSIASKAAGLLTPTATLPLFPSNAKLIKKEEFQEIRLAVLQLVEQEGVVDATINHETARAMAPIKKCNN